MPWDGSGTFNLLYDFRQDLASGLPLSIVRASRTMEQLEDMEQALNEVLNRNGENAMTAPLPMGANRIVDLADATTANDAPTACQIARGDAVWASNFTGSTPTAFVIVNAFGPPALAAGLTIRGLAPETNTGALTVNYNALGVKDVKLSNGITPPAGAVTQSRYFELVYNGTVFVLNVPNSLAIAYGSGTVSSELAPLASPTFTGTPAAPTAAGATSTTQLATTAFVQQEITTLRSNSAGIASGKKMLWFETTAPTGWTTVTTHHNKALRIVSSNGGNSGGSTAFTTVFASRTLSSANIPSLNFSLQAADHQHDALVRGELTSIISGTNTAFHNVWRFDESSNTGQSGPLAVSGTIGQVSPTPLDFAVQYVDAIICQKS